MHTKAKSQVLKFIGTCVAGLGLVLACGGMVSCSGGSGGDAAKSTLAAQAGTWEFVVGDTVEIRLGGKTVKTVDSTDCIKIDGLEGYLVYSRELLDQDKAELYIPGKSQPVVLSDATLFLVTAVMGASYDAQQDAITATGHINPYLYVFIKYGLKTGSGDFYVASVHAMNSSGDVLGITIPQNFMDDPKNPPSEVTVNYDTIGTVPSDLYTCVAGPDGFSAKGDKYTFEVVKNEGAWVIKQAP